MKIISDRTIKVHFKSPCKKCVLNNICNKSCDAFNKRLQDAYCSGWSMILVYIHSVFITLLLALYDVGTRVNYNKVEIYVILSWTIVFALLMYRRIWPDSVLEFLQYEEILYKYNTDWKQEIENGNL